MLRNKLFAPTIEVAAHCDLPCGVYDPAQARIEAESVKAIIGKVKDNDDADFRTRAILIKEQRSELVQNLAEGQVVDLGDGRCRMDYRVLFTTDPGLEERTRRGLIATYAMMFRGLEAAAGAGRNG